VAPREAQHLNETLHRYSGWFKIVSADEGGRDRTCDQELKRLLLYH
jgi:hypothetical protein